MDIQVWLAQMCAKFEQNQTRIGNFGKMALTFLNIYVGAAVLHI
jgi:hypothetical protein